MGIRMLTEPAGIEATRRKASFGLVLLLNSKLLYESVFGTVCWNDVSLNISISLKVSKE